LISNAIYKRLDNSKNKLTKTLPSRWILDYDSNLADMFYLGFYDSFKWCTTFLKFIKTYKDFYHLKKVNILYLKSFEGICKDVRMLRT